MALNIDDKNNARGKSNTNDTKLGLNQDVDNESTTTDSLDDRLKDAYRNFDDSFEEGVDNDIYNAYGGMSLDELLAAPIDSREGNARVDKIMTRFNELLDLLGKKNKVLANIGLIDFDGRKKNFEYPCIVAYHRVVDSNNQLVSVTYSALLVEDGVELEPMIQNIGSRAIEVPTTLFDTYDDPYNDELRALLTTHVAGMHNGVKLIFSGVSNVYRGVDVENPEQVDPILYALSKQVVSAVTDETVHSNADRSASLGKVIRDNNYRLVATLTPHPSTLRDPSGLPIHADLLITTRAYLQQTRGVNQQQRRTPLRNSFELCQVGVMLDLMYVEPSNDRVRSRRDSYVSRSREEDQPHYLGNVIITHLENESMMTLATTLLGISTAMISHADEVYPELLKPSRDANRIALGDIGSIGYEIPDEDGNYGKIDIHSAEFVGEGDAMLYQMVYSNLHPDLMLSIDIPESILGARPVKILEKTTMDEPRALERVIKTITALTDGHFLEDNVWTTDRILSDRPIMIPMGYYLDPKGVMRDLREINYLAALDYAGRKDDREFMQRWEQSLQEDNQTLGVAERISLMEMIVGRDNIHVKGYAWRYFIDRDFVEALARSTVATNIAPSFSNLTDKDKRRLRSNVTDYNEYMVGNSNSASYVSNTRHSRGPSRGAARRGRGYR